MRADAPQLRSNKRVHKMKPAIEPREQFVLDLVMQRQRHFRAIRPNLGELRESHDIEVPARRFKCHLIGRITLHRQQNRASLEAQRSAKTKINRL